MFRQKFILHSKKPESTWKDFSYEIGCFLDNWLDSLQVYSFAGLKELLVVDQMKRKAKFELRDHFLDQWKNLKTINETVELFDGYEDVRRLGPKNKFQSRENFSASASEKKRVNVKDSSLFDKSTGAERNTKISDEREKAFERRVKPKCFICYSENHFRYNCPKNPKNKSVDSINNLEEAKKPLFEGYIFRGLVNGCEMDILRDTAASLDLVSMKFVSPEDFCGENVWIRQPLSLDLVCLPLAVVEIEGDFGKIKTKAAVCASHLDQNRYLLGNKTAALIKEKTGFEFFRTEQINAVLTRSQTKNLRNTETKSKAAEKLDSTVEKSEVIVLSPDVGDTIAIPELDSTAPELGLLDLDKSKFINAQRECAELKDLFIQAEKENPPGANKKYSVTNGLLVKNKEDRLGNQGYLIVIPLMLREKIKALCHESTSAHLGCTKSKHRLTRYFYWPNCFKEMDEYVRSCDACQRAGRPNDKKKAFLKLVPIIEEVFTRINVDACGPFKETTNGNKYIITAMCMASKFPEAVPVVDITSVRVIDALLSIFSRIGFPKIVQCDQGTSFVSALTTEFFDKLGIQVRHSSVQHPQSNPVERVHKTIKRLLRVLCLESGPDWDKHLSSILLALRTVTHESTGYTPSELVYGKNLRTPETLLMEKWMDPPDESEYVTDYVFKLINRLKQCREIATTRMEEQQIKRKKWYDKNAVKREFKVGDLVLVLATSKPNKLAVQWIGPGTIREKISETNYVVENSGKRDRTQIYHVNMLKPYYTRPEFVNLLESGDTSKFVGDQDLEIPYLEKNATIFDFQEIVRNSELEERLESYQINQLREVLEKYSKCFSNEPGLTSLVEHDITLIKDQPVRSKPYRMSQRQNEILKEEIQRMLKMGIIELGESDFSSPMILVEAPGKEPRPCVDYRLLNNIIRTEFFPIPNIEERVEKVSSAKFITVIDLAKGYWQIPLSKRAQRYAAFCTAFGNYRPLRLSFGLKNAPYFFCKLMFQVLEGLEEFAVPYLDDVAIFSDTWEEHIKHLLIVLDRILKANLKIKPSKCRFAQTRVKYLGHVVGCGVRSPAEAKIKSVQEFPTPKTKTNIRALLGLAGYYSRYIEGFSVIAAPLTDALKGKTVKGKITWTSACENAFQTLKKKLTEKPVLRAPKYDREFIVQADASNEGMGVVLSQEDEKGEEHPVLYLSKKFSETEKRYSTTEKECASIIFAIKKLHYYLDGQKFKIITDHNPLTWLKTSASSNSRLMRWYLALQPYEFEVLHRSGKSHKNADSLSRSLADE